MKDNLPILAIESSDELCSVSIMVNETTFVESSIKQKHVHSEKLIALVEQTLKLADIQLNEIKTIAVSEGPGSFTGLRIGMAVAKGMALAQGCYFIAVPTIEALALQISSVLCDNMTFNIINNVNRDEVFFSKYCVKNNKFECVTELKILNREDVVLELNDNEIVYGSYKVNKNNYNISAPDARFVALWAYKYGSDIVTKKYDYIEPNYLKKFVVRGK